MKILLLSSDARLEWWIMPPDDTPLLQACRGCSVLAEGKKGTLADNTPPKWKALLTHEMKTYFFCPTCRAKLDRLSHEIQEIVKDARLYFPSLLKMGEA